MPGQAPTPHHARRCALLTGPRSAARGRCMPRLYVNARADTARCRHFRCARAEEPARIGVSPAGPARILVRRKAGVLFSCKHDIDSPNTVPAAFQQRLFPFSRPPNAISFAFSSRYFPHHVKARDALAAAMQPFILQYYACAIFLEPLTYGIRRFLDTMRHMLAHRMVNTINT